MTYRENDVITRVLVRRFSFNPDPAPGVLTPQTSETLEFLAE